jgi:hypothetical protein
MKLIKLVVSAGRRSAGQLEDRVAQNETSARVKNGPPYKDWLMWRAHDL